MKVKEVEIAKEVIGVMAGDVSPVAMFCLKLTKPAPSPISVILVLNYEVQ